MFTFGSRHASENSVRVRFAGHNCSKNKEPTSIKESNKVFFRGSVGSAFQGDDPLNLPLALFVKRFSVGAEERHGHIHMRLWRDPEKAKK